MSDFFGRLELELREAARRPPRRLPDLRGAPVAAAAVAALALALVPVLVLVGGGDERPPAIEREAETPPRPTLPNERVVATGVAPVAGPWQMLTYESERLADPETGEEYQPAGLPCLGLYLSDPPQDHSGGLGGACGEFPRTPGFSRLQQTVPNIAGGAREILVYGRAPQDARAITLVVDTSVTRRVEPFEGPPGVPGKFYLMAVSPDLDNGIVNWVDEMGNEGSRGIELLPP